jgi:hypothetical protein
MIIICLPSLYSLQQMGGVMTSLIHGEQGSGRILMHGLDGTGKVCLWTTPEHLFSFDDL